MVFGIGRFRARNSFGRVFRFGLAPARRRLIKAIRAGASEYGQALKNFP